MATLPIVRLGHPSLRTPAQAVAKQEIGSPQLERLIDDLAETMRAAGSVGLSAPQVGIGQQVFVYEIPDDPEVPGEAVPLTVIVNPMLVAQPGRLVYDWEGCTSIPDLRGLVPRHPSVRIRGLGRAGELVDAVASGLEARVIQHEYDHLNGMLYLDRMRDLRSLAFLAEWEEYMTGDGDRTEYSAAI
jgi:peptide deformylase